MRNEKTYPYVDFIDGVEVVYFSEDFILGRWAETRWSNGTKKHYLTLGYKYTGHLKELMIDVRHLTPKSCINVDAFCSFCEKFRVGRFQSLLTHTKCYKCAKIINEIGNIFGKLRVIKLSHVGSNYDTHAYWKCLCECGNETVVCGINLRSGVTKSCGCLRVKIGPKNPMYKRYGRNHPRWNPNLTDEARARQRSRVCRTFSDSVFEKDNFTCQISGKRGGNLEAHHLYDYSTYPEKASDINNGITIIKARHREFHNWLGGSRVPYTKQDMIDFCELFYPDAPFLKSL